MSTVVPFAPSELHVAPHGYAPAQTAADRLIEEGLAPLRAVFVGSAGSGKTTALRRLQRRLTDAGIATTVVRPASDLRRLPRGEVVVVDDAHLFDDASLALLEQRLDDPDSALVIAYRPWPASPALVSLTRRLEQTTPSLLLGEVGHTHLRAALGEGRDRCHEQILRLTGGIAWLVYEALRLHEDVSCAQDRDHKGLAEALRVPITHRLDVVAKPLRRFVEAVCLEAPETETTSVEETDELIAEGHAEGLLLLSGRPAPVVVDAVRTSVGIGRIIEILRHGGGGDLAGDAVLADALDGARDVRLAEAVAQRADETLSEDPHRALHLYTRALRHGADPSRIAARRARAAWAAGDLDLAGTIIDARRADAADPDAALVADVAAAIWSERGMMSLAQASYRAVVPVDGISRTHALVAAVATGSEPIAQPSDLDDGAEIPTALGVAMRLLDRGLRTTLSPAGAEAVGDLQRASELYSASGDARPLPELPAVIAAVAAISAGDLRTAQSIVSDALRSSHGAPRLRARLELWSSWIALQRERPADARAALQRAESVEPGLSPRDDALAAAVSVGIARRYEDSAGLANAWRNARARIQRVEPDLFMFLPLGEAVIAATRLGEASALQSQFAQALAISAAAGEPPLWATPLHWAGIQRGILLSRPDILAPHARALVTASAHSPLAATMAQAGRVWTAVLAGTVDADAIEQAAHALAAAGLAWDGARLAGHGAGRTEDRRVIARLLACARELHPREHVREPSEELSAAPRPTSEDGVLSDREREVAELVLQGKTYAEIGAAIFISPRTAEHHIAHIRRRLNATSRSDLLSKLRVALDEPARFSASPDSSPRSAE